jgi:hypothetical protein
MKSPAVLMMATLLSCDATTYTRDASLAASMDTVPEPAAPIGITLLSRKPSASITLTEFPVQPPPSTVAAMFVWFVPAGQLPRAAYARDPSESAATEVGVPETGTLARLVGTTPLARSMLLALITLMVLLPVSLKLAFINSVVGRGPNRNRGDDQIQQRINYADGSVTLIDNEYMGTVTAHHSPNRLRTDRNGFHHGVVGPGERGDTVAPAVHDIDFAVGCIPDHHHRLGTRRNGIGDRGNARRHHARVVAAAVRDVEIAEAVGPAADRSAAGPGLCDGDGTQRGRRERCIRSHRVVSAVQNENTIAALAEEDWADAGIHHTGNAVTGDVNVQIAALAGRICGQHNGMGKARRVASRLRDRINELPQRIVAASQPRDEKHGEQREAKGLLFWNHQQVRPSYGERLRSGLLRSLIVAGESGHGQWKPFGKVAGSVPC